MGVVVGLVMAMVRGGAGAHMGSPVSTYSRTRSSDSGENVTRVSSWKASTSWVGPVGVVSLGWVGSLGVAETSNPTHRRTSGCVTPDLS